MLVSEKISCNIALGFGHLHKKKLRISVQKPETV